MPFATGDKSESPLDSAWAMGEKLMSSKELMDPADNLLFHVLGENEVAHKSFLFLLEAVSVHEVVCQASHWGLNTAQTLDVKLIPFKMIDCL